jgi:hypothetical protein
MRHPEIGRSGYRDRRLPALFADTALLCESAWNKDPVFEVIGTQSGPPGRRSTVASVGDAGARLGMLVVEMIAKIRRAYFAQNKPIKTICKHCRRR